MLICLFDVRYANPKEFLSFMLDIFVNFKIFKNTLGKKIIIKYIAF